MAEIEDMSSHIMFNKQARTFLFIRSEMTVY